MPSTLARSVTNTNTYTQAFLGGFPASRRLLSFCIINLPFRMALTLHVAPPNAYWQTSGLARSGHGGSAKRSVEASSRLRPSPSITWPGALLSPAGSHARTQRQERRPVLCVTQRDNASE